MNRRKYCIFGVSALALAAAAVVLLLWHRSTQNGIALLRVLPDHADLYVLADLAALQRNPAVRGFLAEPPDFAVEEDYRRFVESSGFHYQDDLRQLALAKVGANWVGAARISVDRARMLEYLQTASREGNAEAAQAAGEVHGQKVYSYGTVRPFRVALPEDELALFSIGDTEADESSLIAAALQRHAGAVSDTALSDLTRSGDLPRVERGGALWLVARTPAILDQWSAEPEAGVFRFGAPVLRGSKALYLTVASGLTSLDFEVENLCEDEAAAERFARMIQSLLVLLRAAPGQEPGVQGQLAILLRDISVQRVSDSVMLEWQWDAETLRQLQSASPKSSED